MIAELWRATSELWKSGACSMMRRARAAGRHGLRPGIALAAAAMLGCPAPAEPGVAFDMESCVLRAVSNAAARGAIGIRHESAQAGVDQARARSSPKLNVRAGARYEFENGELLGEADGDFGESLFEFPQNAARRRAAGIGVEMAARLEERTLCMIRSQAVKAYAAALRTGIRLELAEDQAVLSAERRDSIESLADPDSELRERLAAARAGAREALLAADKALAEHILARRRLANIAGFDLAEPFMLAAPEWYAMPAPAFTQCLEWALARRGDAQALQDQARIQAESIRLARLGRWPTPGASFGYRSPDSGDDTDMTRGLYARAYLKIPVWDAGDISAQVRRLGADRLNTLAEIERLKEEVSAAVARNFAAWRQAVDQLEKMREEQSPALDRAKTEAAFQSGALSLHDHEQERLRARERELVLVELNLLCYEAEAELLEAVQASRGDLRAGLPMPTAEKQKEEP